VAGALSFISGVTTYSWSHAFWSHAFRRPAARHFQLSILHNIGHLVFGVAGLLLARTVSGARNYLLAAGLIYLVFSLL
jgi:Domain of unknown function (DUF4383)